MVWYTVRVSSRFIFWTELMKSSHLSIGDTPFFWPSSKRSSYSIHSPGLNKQMPQSCFHQFIASVCMSSIIIFFPIVDHITYFLLSIAIAAVTYVISSCESYILFFYENLRKRLLMQLRHFVLVRIRFMELSKMNCYYALCSALCTFLRFSSYQMVFLITFIVWLFCGFV